MLGVLGGMGPLATVDFLSKLVQCTDADKDQHHIPMVVWSVPQVPDRSNHIVLGAENPLPELLKGVRALQASGASVIAMPCNTAHYWHDQLVASTGASILHIADAVAFEISQLAFDVRKIGVLATSGTVKSGIYQEKLARPGWDVLFPSSKDQQDLMEGIALAKSSKLHRAKKIFLEQVDILKSKGADVIVLGCTDLPAVLNKSTDLIDSNRALARRCIRWFDAVYHGKVTVPAYEKINPIVTPMGL